MYDIEDEVSLPYVHTQYTWYSVVNIQQEKGRDVLVERLTASTVTHASRVRAPLIRSCVWFSEKYPCFSLFNLTGRSHYSDILYIVYLSHSELLRTERVTADPDIYYIHGP